MMFNCRAGPRTTHSNSAYHRLFCTPFAYYEDESVITLFFLWWSFNCACRQAGPCKKTGVLDDELS